MDRLPGRPPGTRCAFHADHLRRIASTRNEAYLSLSDIVGKYGLLTAARIGLWAIGVLVLALASPGIRPKQVSPVSASALAIVAAGEILGRGLFYLAVVPMTVPGGAFFRNKLFESAVLARAKERSNGFARP